MSKQIKLEEMSPKIYSNESRDYQVLCRAFDCLFNGIKFDIDAVLHIIDTASIPNVLLPLLQTKLAFFSNYSFTDDQLREILKAFPYIVKHKGTKKAVEEAINLYLRINRLNGDYDIDILRKDVFTYYKDNFDETLFKFITYYTTPQDSTYEKTAQLLSDKIITDDNFQVEADNVVTHNYGFDESVNSSITELDSDYRFENNHSGYEELYTSLFDDVSKENKAPIVLTKKPTNIDPFPQNTYYQKTSDGIYTKLVEKPTDWDNTPFPQNTYYQNCEISKNVQLKYVDCVVNDITYSNFNKEVSLMKLDLKINNIQAIFELDYRYAYRQYVSDTLASIKYSIITNKNKFIKFCSLYTNRFTSSSVIVGQFIIRIDKLNIVVYRKIGNTNKEIFNTTFSTYDKMNADVYQAMGIEVPEISKEHIVEIDVQIYDELIESALFDVFNSINGNHTLLCNSASIKSTANNKIDYYEDYWNTTNIDLGQYNLFIFPILQNNILTCKSGQSEIKVSISNNQNTDYRIKNLPYWESWNNNLLLRDKTDYFITDLSTININKVNKDNKEYQTSCVNFTENIEGFSIDSETFVNKMQSDHSNFNLSTGLNFLNILKVSINEKNITIDSKRPEETLNTGLNLFLKNIKDNNTEGQYFSGFDLNNFDESQTLQLHCSKQQNNDVYTYKYTISMSSNPDDPGYTRQTDLPTSVPSSAAEAGIKAWVLHSCGFYSSNIFFNIQPGTTNSHELKIQLNQSIPTGIEHQVSSIDLSDDINKYAGYNLCTDIELSSSGVTYTTSDEENSKSLLLNFLQSYVPDELLSNVDEFYFVNDRIGQWQLYKSPSDAKPGNDKHLLLDWMTTDDLSNNFHIDNIYITDFSDNAYIKIKLKSDTDRMPKFSDANYFLHLDETWTYVKNDLIGRLWKCDEKYMVTNSFFTFPRNKFYTKNGNDKEYLTVKPDDWDNASFPQDKYYKGNDEPLTENPYGTIDYPYNFGLYILSVIPTSHVPPYQEGTSKVYVHMRIKESPDLLYDNNKWYLLSNDGFIEILTSALNTYGITVPNIVNELYVLNIIQSSVKYNESGLNFLASNSNNKSYTDFYINSEMINESSKRFNIYRKRLQDTNFMILKNKITEKELNDLGISFVDLSADIIGNKYYIRNVINRPYVKQVINKSISELDTIDTQISKTYIPWYPAVKITLDKITTLNAFNRICDKYTPIIYDSEGKWNLNTLKDIGKIISKIQYYHNDELIQEMVPLNEDKFDLNIKLAWQDSNFISSVSSSSQNLTIDNLDKFKKYLLNSGILVNGLNNCTIEFNGSDKYKKLGLKLNGGSEKTYSYSINTHTSNSAIESNFTATDMYDVLKEKFSSDFVHKKQNLYFEQVTSDVHLSVKSYSNIPGSFITAYIRDNDKFFNFYNTIKYNDNDITFTRLTDREDFLTYFRQSSYASSFNLNMFKPLISQLKSIPFWVIMQSGKVLWMSNPILSINAAEGLSPISDMDDEFIDATSILIRSDDLADVVFSLNSKISINAELTHRQPNWILRDASHEIIWGKDEPKKSFNDVKNEFKLKIKYKNTELDYTPSQYDDIRIYIEYIPANPDIGIKLDDIQSETGKVICEFSVNFNVLYNFELETLSAKFEIPYYWSKQETGTVLRNYNYLNPYTQSDDYKYFNNDKNYSKPYWFNFKEYIKHIRLPLKGLSRIPGYAFAGTSIKDIYISKNIKRINQSAFYNCQNLETLFIELPQEIFEEVTIIEDEHDTIDGNVEATFVSPHELFIKLKDEPKDWDTNYNNYYIFDADQTKPYIKNTNRTFISNEVYKKINMEYNIKNNNRYEINDYIININLKSQPYDSKILDELLKFILPSGFTYQINYV